MKQDSEGLGNEWDDGDEATTVYQEGMLEQARAVLSKMAAAEPGTSGELEAVETWYISEDRRTKLSLSAKEVIERCRTGALSQATLVWHEGLDNWTRLSDVPELKLVLGALSEQTPSVAEKSLTPALKPPPASAPRGPGSSGLGFPSLPAPPVLGTGGRGGGEATTRVSPNPEPLRPRFESDATQVYPASASVVTASDWSPPQRPRRGRAGVLVLAFASCFGIGALAFGSAVSSAPATPVEYNLDTMLGDTRRAPTESAKPSEPEEPRVATTAVSEANSKRDEATAVNSARTTAPTEAAPGSAETDIAKAMREALAKKAAGGAPGAKR
ncbi:MAG: domain 2 [Pseudomonadota bacterium]|jgi:hypothetical protein